MNLDHSFNISSQDLELNTQDSSVFSAHPQLSDYVNTLPQKSKYAPCLAVFNNEIYIAWTGTNKHLNIASSPDGKNFGAAHTLSEKSDAAPSLAVFNERLYIAWRGTDIDHHLNVASSLDGQNFGMANVLHQKTISSPSLVVFNDQLYIAWSGTKIFTHHLNVASSLDGSDFGPANTLREKSYKGPSLTVFKNKLYIGWVGTDKHFSLNVAESTNGSSFGPANTLPDKYGGDKCEVFLGTISNNTNLAIGFATRRYSHPALLSGINESSLDKFRFSQQHKTYNRTNPTWVNFNGHMYIAWTGTNKKLNVSTFENIFCGDE